jgi:hypothetical protein
VLPPPTVPAAADATTVHVPGPTIESVQVCAAWSALQTDGVDDEYVTVWPDELVAVSADGAAAVVRASSASKETVWVTRPRTVTAAVGEVPVVLSPSSPKGPAPQHLTMAAFVAQTEDVLTATLVTDVMPET